MAEVWKSQSPDIYKAWLQTILDEATDELSNWETKFIDDITSKVMNGWALTQFQAEKLEEIYAKYTD